MEQRIKLLWSFFSSLSLFYTFCTLYTHLFLLLCMFFFTFFYSFRAERVFFRIFSRVLLSFFRSAKKGNKHWLGTNVDSTETHKQCRIDCVHKILRALGEKQGKNAWKNKWDDGDNFLFVASVRKQNIKFAEYFGYISLVNIQTFLIFVNYGLSLNGINAVKYILNYAEAKSAVFATICLVCIHTKAY